MIWHPDIPAGAYHSRDMDVIRNIPELILEFISRRDFLGVYLGALGVWCLWLGFRGLGLGNTKGFGWRAADVAGEAAASVGRAWFAIAAGLLGAGAGLWLSS